MRSHRMTNRGIISGYARLNKKIDDMNSRLDILLKLLTSPVKMSRNDAFLLRTLPSHLLKTYFTLQYYGCATASQVAEQTGKARAVESSYLCQLATMGYITKSRNSRIVRFKIEQAS